MTVSVTTEKAIDGLARELFEWSAPGEAWDRATDNERAALSVDLSTTGHSHPLPTHAAAAQVLDLLGLVAIDAALVEAVKSGEVEIVFRSRVTDAPSPSLVEAIQAFDAQLAQLGGR
jgi:hypothetical protein